MLVKVPLGACLGTLAKQRGLTTRERHWHKSMEEELSIPGGRTGRELAWEELGEGQPGFQSSGAQRVHKMLVQHRSEEVLRGQWYPGFGHLSLLWHRHSLDRETLTALPIPSLPSPYLSLNGFSLGPLQAQTL